MGIYEHTDAVLTKLLRIDDPQITRIPDIDTQEPMVSLIGIPRLLFPSQITPRVFNIEDSQTPFVRRSVKDKLQTAITLLPKHYSLVLIEAQRTVEYQTRVFQQTLTEMKNSHKELSQKEILALTRTIASDPKLFSPHTTGGAIDVAIANQDSNTYLDMGNLFQHDETAATEYKGLNAEQQKNRQLLTGIMKQSGFVNYEREWWHWSYGDKLWAHINHQPHALYAPV